MQSVPESYSTPGFAAFYDSMVAALPKEYEPGKDIELYWSLLQAVLASQGHASVLEVCTGTGRVVAGLAERLAGQPNWTVRFLGLDSSEEMLQAATRKLPLAALPPNVNCSWVPGDMAFLPPPAAMPGSAPFDLVILSAGSFHHLLTRTAQVSCLRGIRRLLAQHPAARAVINLLPSAHLRAAPGSVTLAGNYRRECLAEALEVQPDGGRVWRQQFRLTVRPQLEGAVQQQRSGGGAQPSKGLPVTERSTGEGSMQGAQQQQQQQQQCGGAEWSCQEGWALREVEPGELRQLLGECGLEVLEQRASFGGSSLGPGWEGPGRVFVVGPQWQS